MAPGSKVLVLRVDAFFAPAFFDGFEGGFVFRVLALVIGLFDPLLELGAHLLQDLLVVFGLGEVVDFVGVGIEVVEFFGHTRPVRGGLGGGELSLVVHGLQFFVIRVSAAVVELEQRAIGFEILDVMVAFAHDRADPVDGEVTAVAAGEYDIAFEVGSEDVLRIKMFRDRQSGQGEGAGGNVDQVDQVVSPGARFDGVLEHWCDHYQGDVKAFFVAKLFGAWEFATVVGKDEEDGVLPLSLGLEAGHDVSDFLIGDFDGVIVGGDFLTRFGDVGVLWWDADLERVGQGVL